jgi:hypothetical protein
VSFAAVAPWPRSEQPLSTAQLTLQLVPFEHVVVHESSSPAALQLSAGHEHPQPVHTFSTPLSLRLVLGEHDDVVGAHASVPVSEPASIAEEASFALASGEPLAGPLGKSASKSFPQAVPSAPRTRASRPVV